MQQTFQQFAVMTRQNDVVVADGVGEEVGGGDRIGQTDDLLRSTEVGLRLVLGQAKRHLMGCRAAHELALLDEMA